MKDCANLEEISAFDSIDEYERFKVFLEENLKKNYISEIPVEKYYTDFNSWNEEKWYLCGTTKWRLVPPDFPFKGLFVKV